MGVKRMTYISGAMSGLPANNYPAFFQAEGKLRDHGHIVFNPARVDGDPEWSWEKWMRASIKMLMECDGVATLPGWEQSRGANVEVRLAMDLGIPYGPVESWLNVGAGK